MVRYSAGRWKSNEGSVFASWVSASSCVSLTAKKQLLSVCVKLCVCCRAHMQEHRHTHFIPPAPTGRIRLYLFTR